MDNHNSDDEPKVTLNSFTLPTLQISPDEARLMLFGNFTALPEDIELHVSQETYTALKNLLGLLCVEKCTNQITTMDSELVLRDAALASQIILLEDILTNITVS